MNAIDFRFIAPRNGSQTDAFEEFCCQIARRNPDVPAGSEFLRYRGAGGDGGVECIWKLPNGDEWGWQVKYMFDLDQIKQALDDSIATAISVHPRLTRYIICLPFTLTGPTGRKGKSQTEKFDAWRAQWTAQALAVNVAMQVELVTPTMLADDLLRFDPDGGRRRYWFDEQILSDAWFQRHLDDMRSHATPRYTPELRIETPIAIAFEAIRRTDVFFIPLKERIQTFRQVFAHWQESLAGTYDGGLRPAFPLALRDDGESGQNLLQEVGETYRHFVEQHHQPQDVHALCIKTEEALNHFRQLRAALAADLEAEHGSGVADSASFRQFRAEYHVDFPALHVDHADEVIGFLEELLTWLASPIAQLSYADAFLLLGDAGVGKTHAICDSADLHAARNLRTVVLFGERFASAHDPWENIRQYLGFDGNFSRDGLLAALDAAGETSGNPLLLCIDALNETRPRTYWRERLAAFLNQVQPYRFIRTCMSCRTTYESQVIPPHLRLLSITHEGFAGIEFDACRAFFAHYGLEPPVTPMLQPEFTNPLFLRLICDAARAAGYDRLPSGWFGIHTAITALLWEKNKLFAAEYDLHPNHRVPECALKAFIQAAEDEQQPFLSWSLAARIVEEARPGLPAGGPLLDWLVREGLFSVDAPPHMADQIPEDRVRIAFERLGDHLLTAQWLDPLHPETIHAAFAPGGTLAFAIADEDALAGYRGVIEALAVQVPERFEIELPDCIAGNPVWESVLKITLEAMPWRDPTRLTPRACDFFRQGFSLYGYAYRAFDIALTIGVQPSVVDAFWLHEVLSDVSMPQRDAFWCRYLHTGYEEHGPVWKLLRTAFEVDATAVPVDMTERWAILLLWFCAAADRRVRDTATRALVQITIPVPVLWAHLTERFLTIDDEYIVERCLSAAYGTLLRVRDPDAIAALAHVVYHSIFANPSSVQHATIRDYARCILELAAHDEVLPAGITEAVYLPPYTSDWPLIIPEVDDIDRYKDTHQVLPRLYASCMMLDFNRYTLAALHRYQHQINQHAMARWIFQHILDIGYASDLHADYDSYLLRRYGGGRGKPVWAERIGKKYQWIALARLAARLADNSEPKTDPWDAAPLRTPLTFPWGRDIDPSLPLHCEQAKKQPAWWLPTQYDFDAVAVLSDTDWAARYDDMPDSAAMLAERQDCEGRRWIVIESLPEWNAATAMEEAHHYRRIWLYIQSYCIATPDAPQFWQWAQQQQFIGGWMLRGAEFHEGFVGEYPWATVFNLYPDDTAALGRIGGEQAPPCEGYPTSNKLYAEYQYDSYKEGNISILLPARQFFEATNLKWNGKNGYAAPDGALCFTDPSVLEPGPSALLGEVTFLQSFLVTHNLTLVWIVFGEKLVVGNYEVRLSYSQAHMLTDQGIRSSEPVIAND